MTGRTEEYVQRYVCAQALCCEVLLFHLQDKLAFNDLLLALCSYSIVLAGGSSSKEGCRNEIDFPNSKEIQKFMPVPGSWKCGYRFDVDC